MATLAELKTRIRLETNRDDISSGGEAEQALVDAITSAIGYHALELFWFNRALGTSPTSGGASTVSLPAGMLYANSISYSGSELMKVPLEAIEHDTAQGIPSAWADDGDSVRVWPTPDGVYTLNFAGVADIGVPGSDGASNAWTTAAYDLIDARARIILYRDYWRDAEGAQIAAVAENEALARLRSETRRRAVTPRRPFDNIHVVPSFSIVNG